MRATFVRYSPVGNHVGAGVMLWPQNGCKIAGITDVGPHALRGTHASLATRAGATGQLVAGSSGHASTEVTNRHYTRADATADARVGVALEVLAGGLIESALESVPQSKKLRAVTRSVSRKTNSVT